MKKIFYLFYLLLCGAVLTACQNQPLTTSTESEIVENTETIESTIEESGSEVATDTPATQIQTGTILVTDEAGYTAEITIQVSQLIKGTDKEKLNHEWHYFGEEGKFEDLGLTPETTAYVIGTIAYANKSEGGFSLTGIDSSKRVWLGLAPESNDGIIMYSSSPSRGINNTGMLDISPKIEKDTWGPVTFILANDGFFTPADPEGASHLQEAALQYVTFATGKVTKSENFKIIDTLNGLPLTASW